MRPLTFRHQVTDQHTQVCNFKLEFLLEHRRSIQVKHLNAFATVVIHTETISIIQKYNLGLILMQEGQKS